MNKTVCTLLGALFLTLGVGNSIAQKPVFTTAKIQKANLFLNGAEMSHQATVNLKSGSNEIVIKNVANNMDENSIRVSSNKPITILSVSFSNRYYDEYETNPNTVLVKKAKDSIEWVEKEIAQLTNVISTDQQAIVLLDKNQTAGGTQTGITVAELSKLVDYYRQKRVELSNSVQANEKQKKELNNTLVRLKNQLTVREGEQEKISDGKIVLQLMSEQAQTIALNLTYNTTLAYWQPFYEIESKGTDQPLNLATKAQVKQSTGVDWKQVKLSFSNNMPKANNNIPYFETWWLSFYKPAETPKTYAKQMNAPTRNMMTGSSGISIDYAKEDGSASYQTLSAADFTTTVEQSLSVNYEVNLPYDILSNGKAHTVALSNQSIPASYNHYAAPKLNKDAFLLARISDYGQYNILRGEANIIFEGQYVGKTILDASTTKDTLDIALGVDKNVIINRERLKEKSGGKIFSGKREVQFVYKISVRNNKKSPINLVLKDQYPTSTDKDIEVTLTDSQGAAINETVGTLTWDMKIKAGETQEVTSGYKVKYPKDKTISNL